MQQPSASQPTLLSASPDGQSNSSDPAQRQTAAASPDSAPIAELKPTYVAISDGRKFSVPSLVGLPIRAAIELTATQGLQVQITGSGTVREQAPAPGTKVPTGTKVVVRCGK